MKIKQLKFLLTRSLPIIIALYVFIEGENKQFGKSCQIYQKTSGTELSGSDKC